MNEERGEWSVVISGFPRDPYAVFRPELNDLDERVFGRRGLDLIGMCFSPEEHFPAELVGNWTLDEAERAAAAFRDVGADVRVIRTDEVQDVRHRASEVWATQCTETFCFTEVDDLVSILGAVNTRDNLAHFQTGTPKWEKERATNHYHPSLGESAEEAVVAELRSIRCLIASLCEAYPDGAFTIEQAPQNCVSFWQMTDDSPRGDSINADDGPLPEKVWCQRCGKHRPFRQIRSQHPALPKAEWGQCKECGDKLIIRRGQRLIHIQPAKGPE